MTRQILLPLFSFFFSFHIYVLGVDLLYVRAIVELTFFS